MTTSNAINANDVGLIRYQGVGIFDSVTTTDHYLLIGDAANGITNVIPSVTAGIPVISQGVAVDPVFGTAVVAGGGTGATTLTGVLTGNGTSAITANAVTQYGTVIAGTSNAVSSIAPSATSGVPYISQGAAANPAFGTAVVAGGGTGAVTLTNHGVLIGQATSAIVATAAGSAGQVLQSGGAAADPVYSTATYPATTTINQVVYSSANNVVGGITAANNGTMISGTTGVPSWLANGTTGQLLTATTGSPPSWAAAPGISVVTGQLFTTSGAFTYTPTASMKYVIVELVGGGGGSGGCSGAASNYASTGGGGGGGYASFILTAAQVGVSLTGSVGVGGAAGAAGANNGGNGGNTTLATAAAWTVGGGIGSVGVVRATPNVNSGGGLGGTVTTGTGIILSSTSGGQGNDCTASTSLVITGMGGHSQYGRGGKGRSAQTPSGTLTGSIAYGYGSGAGGSYTINSVDVAGGIGNNGVAIFQEFI